MVKVDQVKSLRLFNKHMNCSYKTKQQKTNKQQQQQKNPLHFLVAERQAAASFISIVLWIFKTAKTALAWISLYFVH